MRIYFLDDDRTIARVIRWRWLRRVTAILYRDERCASSANRHGSGHVGWVFHGRRPRQGVGMELRHDDWDGSFMIEELRAKMIEVEGDPWRPVSGVADLGAERRAPTVRVLNERTHADIDAELDRALERSPDEADRGID